MSTEADSATVLVVQDRQWFGNPRLGAFVVTIDSRRVGSAPVRGELATQVQPGVHKLRIRQWWYRSPEVEVVVPPGATVLLRADIPKHLGFAKRWTLFMFTPSRAVMLTRDEA